MNPLDVIYDDLCELSDDTICQWRRSATVIRALASAGDLRSRLIMARAIVLFLRLDREGKELFVDELSREQARRHKRK